MVCVSSLQGLEKPWFKVRRFLSKMTRVLVSLLALAASFVATLSELSSNLTYIQIQVLR